MSIQSEIDRISQNIVNTYSVLEDAGAIMPASLTTQNLPDTAASIQAVLFKEQTLTKEQRMQARANLGIVGKAYVTDYGASPSASADENTTAFQAALAENRVVFVPGGTYEISDTLVVRANCELELSQDTVLKFTNPSKNCITLLRIATLRGNHATIFVPYELTANAINCDGGDDFALLNPDSLAVSNNTAVPPFTKWDPQWKMSRYITDINICKPNENGNLYSNTGDCYGNAIYIHCNNEDWPVNYMHGVSMSGIRIAGGFNHGIRIYNIGPHVDSWNHDARIEAVIDACKIAVSVENAYYNRLAVTVQPRVAADGSVYAEHGIKLIDSPGTDLSSSRVWDWNDKKSKWQSDNEYQHIALYGDCAGVILDDYMYYAQSTFDIRDLIYTDTSSNIEKMTILQEPITRWFKPVDGVPYFSDGNFDKKLMTQADIDVYFDTDVVKSFTDVLPTATDTDGTIFNGIGYKNGYISNSGFVEADYYVGTGFIPCNAGSVVHIGDMNFDSGDDNCRLVVYDSQKNRINQINRGLILSNTNTNFDCIRTENGIAITVKNTVANNGCAFVRFSVYHSCVGENPMVAIDEEIKYTAEGFLADGVKIKNDSIVLTSSSGKAFKLVVDDSGTLSTTPIE